MSVLSWWSRYDQRPLLYVPTPYMISHCANDYVHVRADNILVEIIARMWIVMMMMVCLFAACRNGIWTQLSGHLQLNQHGGHLLVQLSTIVLTEVEVLGLNVVIKFARYDMVLCLMALKRSGEIDWLRYGGTDPMFCGHVLNKVQVFNVTPLCANKKYNTGYVAVVNGPSWQA